MTGEALIGTLSEYNPRWLQSSWGNEWYKPSSYRFRFMLPRVKKNCTQRSVGTGGRTRGNYFNIPGRYPTFATNSKSVRVRKEKQPADLNI
jgi:hypothetical protein